METLEAGRYGPRHPAHPTPLILCLEKKGWLAATGIHAVIASSLLPQQLPSDSVEHELQR